MPFRAFDDSDPPFEIVGWGKVDYVLMPFRAFDDSDDREEVSSWLRAVSLNALPGIR